MDIWSLFFGWDKEDINFLSQPSPGFAGAGATEPLPEDLATSRGRSVAWLNPMVRGLGNT